MFQELPDGQSVGATAYFEPHCDFDDASVARAGPVDLVVSPISSALLGVGPVAYPLVMGDINLVRDTKLAIWSNCRAFNRKGSGIIGTHKHTHINTFIRQYRHKWYKYTHR